MAGEHTLAVQKGHTMMHNLHPLTNAPTKCQPSTSYRLQEVAKTRF